MTLQDLQPHIEEALKTEEPGQDEMAQYTGFIDHTSLKNTDTEITVTAFCEKVVAFDHHKYGLPALPAVCVWPCFAEAASKVLKNHPTQVACVAGAFPSGQATLKVKLAEVAEALENGADEIDVVVHRGLAGEQRFDQIEEEVRLLKECCGNHKLKVILETGEFDSMPLLKKTGMAVLRGGADFLKTSTGKIPEGATLRKSAVLMLCLKEFYKETGVKRGVKISGGVKTCKAAAQNIALVKAVMRKEFVNSEYFRIGAGSFTPVLLNALNSVKNHPWD